MTIEKFYETLKFVVELDRDRHLQTSLDAIRDALNNLVGASAQPQHQIALAHAMTAFTADAEGLGSSLTPSQLSTIADVGGSEFFDPFIAEKVTKSIATNAMTPSVARDFVQDLASRRTEYLTTIKQTLHGLRNLGVSSAELGPGSADLTFLIPRDLFDNQLSTFAKELTFIHRFIQDFSEAVTGKAESVVLESLSSSIPTIALVADPVVVATMAEVVNKFLETWKKIEKIRLVREQVADLGLKGEAIEQLTAQITTTVEEVVEESIEIILMDYPGDPGRKYELESALRQNTHRLFGQIERGLTIQFRVNPKANGDKAEQDALETVTRLSREMQFPEIKNEPILVTDDQVIGDDFDTISVPKRTTAYVRRQRK
jgi:hypothetical protein